MTLSKISILTKRLILFSILSLVLGTTSFIGLKVWKFYNPPPVIIIEEKPTAQYGKLPLPIFPNSSVSTSNFSYSIDTIDGNLPAFDKLIKVYIIPPAFATLLSPQKSKELAEKLNLIPIPEVISENEYKFSNLDSTMHIKLDTGNFIYQKQSTVSAIPVTPNPENELKQNFMSTLAGLGYLKDELREGEIKIVYLKKSNGGFKPVNIQESQVTQISLWPSNIDGKQIYTPSNESALINAVALGSFKDITSYISINYNFWPVDTSTFETYPLKSSYEALDDLKAGKGVILKEPGVSKISITEVKLGYYQPDEYVSYLQPIYVFEGSEFRAYVPAITDNYYE